MVDVSIHIRPGAPLEVYRDTDESTVIRLADGRKVRLLGIRPEEAGTVLLIFRTEYHRKADVVAEAEDDGG